MTGGPSLPSPNPPPSLPPGFVPLRMSFSAYSPLPILAHSPVSRHRPLNSQSRCRGVSIPRQALPACSCPETSPLEVSFGSDFWHTWPSGMKGGHSQSSQRQVFSEAERPAELQQGVWCGSSLQSSAGRTLCRCLPTIIKNSKFTWRQFCPDHCTGRYGPPRLCPPGTPGEDTPALRLLITRGPGGNAASCFK